MKSFKVLTWRDVSETFKIDSGVEKAVVVNGIDGIFVTDSPFCNCDSLSKT